VPGRTVIGEPHVAQLEDWLDHFNADLPPLKDFLLPGGRPGAAACHMARAIARRAERRSWTLAHIEAVNPASLKYLNRLSDLLFVLSRVIGRHEGGDEVIWQQRR
jgi:cob(I)alamin adenosyltransferase